MPRPKSKPDHIDTSKIPKWWEIKVIKVKEAISVNDKTIIILTEDGTQFDCIINDQ